MDNSWQIKCTSSWTSPSPPLPLPLQLPPLPLSSQLPTPLGPRNQMDMNAGHYYHPYIPEESRAIDRGTVQEPLVFSTLNLGSSSKSAKPDLGNSFLALLSGSPQQLQCDFQQPNSKPVVTSSKLPFLDSSIVAGGAGYGVSAAGFTSFPQLNGNISIGNGTELCPVVASRQMPTSAGSRVLHNNLQTKHLHLRGAESAQPVLNAVHGSEIGREASSLTWGLVAGTSVTNFSSQHQTMNIHALPRTASEAKSAVSVHPPAFARGYPRVFCLHTKKNVHRVVSQHAGSSAVNPGDAVRLGSGETIAQWCRAYFVKYGMGFPDDSSGWDWPDGMPTSGGSTKRTAIAVSKMPKNSDVSQLVDSFGALLRSGQPWTEFASPNCSYTGNSILGKSIKRVTHDGQQKNGVDGHNRHIASNGFGATSHNIFPAPSNTQMLQTAKDGTMSKCMRISKSTPEKGGQNNDRHMIVDYTDFIGRGGNQFTATANLGNLKSFDTVSNFIRCGNSSEAFIADRDAICSNVELRLGQPSQQCQTLGVSILPPFRPQVFGGLCHPEKSQFFEPQVHGGSLHSILPGKKSNSLGHQAALASLTDESRQNLCFKPFTSGSNQGEKESQPNLMCHALRHLNAVDSTKLDQLKGDATKSSLISMFLSHFTTPLEVDVQPQAPNDSVSSRKHFVTRKEANGMENKSHINRHGVPEHMGKSKGLRTVADNCSHVSAIPNSSFPGKQMPDANPFAGAPDGNFLHNNYARYDRQFSTRSHQTSVILPDAASNARNSFNELGKVPYLGNSDHLNPMVLRSVHSAASVMAGTGLFSAAAPVGFASSNSINLANLTSALTNKKSNDCHMLDENFRLLAQRHIAELSKKDLSISTLETSPEQELPYYPFSVDMQRKGSQECIVTAEELKEGPYHTNKQHDAYEDPVRAHQQCFSRYLSGDVEKLPGMEGLNNCCSISTSTQGIPLSSKEPCVQCPRFHDHGADEKPLLRLGRTENKVSIDSGEHERCHHRESNPYCTVNSGCPLYSKCLTACYISRGEAPTDTSKEHDECVGGRSPGLVATVFDNDHTTSENRRILLSHGEHLKIHPAQWRDIPSKAIVNSNATSIERPAEVLDAKATVEDQLADTAAKRSGGTGQVTDQWKEQQMSNGSSGCSAPAVTEVTVEVSNLNSRNVDSGDDRYVHVPVIDEGSRIEKCGSSDDALGNGSWGKISYVTGSIVPTKAGSSNLLKQSSLDLIDERNSNLKKVGNHIQDGKQQFVRGPKAEKKRKVMKWKRLDSSFPGSGLSPMECDSPKQNYKHSNLHLHAAKERQLRAEHGRKKTCCLYTYGPSSSLKRKRSVLSVAKHLPCKRNLHLSEDHHGVWVDDYRTKLKGNTHSLKIPKIAAERKVKRGPTTDFKKHFPEINHVDDRKPSKTISVGHTKIIFSHGVETCDKKRKPVVRGNSGIISNGKLAARPAKIVSLSSVLKVAKRCADIETEVEPKLTSSYETQKGCFNETEGCYNEKEREDEDQCENTMGVNGVVPNIFDTKKAFGSKNGGSVDELSRLNKDRGSTVHKSLGFGTSSGYHIRMKTRSKEIRKRSLYELTGKDKLTQQQDRLSNLSGNKHFRSMEAESCVKKICQFGLVDSLQQKQPNSSKFLRKNSNWFYKTDFTSYEKPCLKNAEDDLDHTREPTFSSKGSTSEARHLDSDAFCCVCGSSNQDEINGLLECNSCLIRVHQACYGVSKVPKGRWCCRPCRTNCNNIVCVLCGYGGGAMTRALRSCNVVKSLLEAWKVGGGTTSISIASSDTIQVELDLLNPTSKDGTSLLEEPGSVPVMRPINIEPFPRAMSKMNSQKDSDLQRNSNSSLGNFQVHNTVAAGVVDPTVTQWVHMVCGLWTPGTRCPNVDTMSTFDVSGASRPKKNMVCSMCNRPGGLCIQCRVMNCSVHFHPWCAHQKGLLQSEVEGDDDEKVGFYGRCMLHATNSDGHTDNHLLVAKIENRGEEEEFTCARTEGFKGRRRGEGFRHNIHLPSNDNNGCLVTQEQINAWLHINGQKSCIKGLVKPPGSDVEYDCRKEYARYKQVKGWKHLVVYKSGIHALGLYTTQFISRGAMVVEYVGEIVGLRVADKREKEYQSGRKLQYKSACYFFRIDKEHIIDATRKGGIARFVNHSCLPNCVAKVISMRNGKKVVFFAERDINPGEEITYDYHFNHEDEGKKIPCFCNSKNCRRYLN